MLQNPCKTLGFKKNMVYKIPPGGGEVNHIQPVAYNNMDPQWRSKNAEKVKHIKGRLLDQAMILFKCVPFLN